MPVFEEAYVVLAQNDHGPILVVKPINARPELRVLRYTDTYPSNDFDQVGGCGERIGVSPYSRALKADFGAERYRVGVIVALMQFYGAFRVLKQLPALLRPQGMSRSSAPLPDQ